ncbi:MAG: helix-turn-helix transcriptional regulator [Tannerellaceae bacterium]|jgi:AraC-like DNA-binding protein|nr:helix-turn-helix transcriptional regulator [Tannerellaceae bacterium]
MKYIPHYDYFRQSNAEEIHIDVAGLHYIKPYFSTNALHSLTYYDITFITEGSGFFTVDDQTHIVKPQDIIFSKPGKARNWDNKNIKDGYVLVFKEEAIQTLFNDRNFLQNLSFFSLSRYSAKTTPNEEACAGIRTAVLNLKASLPATKEKLALVRPLVHEVFTLLNRAYINEHNVLPLLPPEESKQLKNRYVNEFLLLVNAHYLQQHSIRFYADRLSITPSYLNEIIKKNIGVNAKQYLQNRIVQEAKRLLTHTDLTISTISSTLCFENAQYFIRFFRTQTQYTPLEYRNLAK